MAATLQPPPPFSQRHDFGGLSLAMGRASGSSSTSSSDGGEGEAGGQQRRPHSPPQPIPRPRPGGFAEQQLEAQPSSAGYADALAMSPAASDAADCFLDAHSEPVSTASSFDADRADDVLARIRLAAAAAAALGPSPSSSDASAPPAAPAAAQALQQERQRRAAAEASAAQWRQQLDEISALLFSFRSGRPLPSVSAEASAAGVAAEVCSTLQATAAQCQAAEAEAAALRQQACDAAAAAADAALVARLVAGICARAATAADLEERWHGERGLLEWRLEQAARMGQAMLRHQKEHRGEAEPWRQQLLNTAVSVGCSILGASAAVLIIRHHSSR